MPYRSPPPLLRLRIDVLQVGEPEVDVKGDRVLRNYRFKARVRWVEHYQDSIEPVHLPRPWWARAFLYIKMLWW